MLQRVENTDVQVRSVTLFLCGDVMSGRGIYQMLPHPLALARGAVDL